MHDHICKITLLALNPSENQGEYDKLYETREKFHSILRYAECLQGFTEIKQVSAHSIQVCRGINGDQCLNTFVLRVEHPYIVGKLEKVLDMGELTFHAEKTAR